MKVKATSGVPACDYEPSHGEVAEKKSEFDINEDVSKLTLKIANIFSDLSQRIANLEKNFDELSMQINLQNVMNNEALEDFNRLKSEVQELKLLMEEFRTAGQPLHLDFLNHIQLENRDVGANSQKASRGTSGGTITTFASDIDNDGIMIELNSLKEQMSELSESLNMHGNCLKKLKCESFVKLMKDFEELSEAVQSVKCQQMEANSDELKFALKSIQAKISDVCCQQEATVQQVAKSKEEVSEALRSMRMNLESRINERMWSRSTTSNESSRILNTQNLAKSTDCDGEPSQKSSEKFFQPPGQSSCQDPQSFPSVKKEESKCSNYAYQYRYPMCDAQLSDPPQRKFTTSSHPETPATNKSETSGHINFKQPSMDFIDDLSEGKQRPDCGDAGCSCCNQNYYPSNIVRSFCSLHEQVSSQSFCLKRLIHDMGLKLDRCEFEMCHRQLGDVIDMVMEMKRNQANPSTAAGGVIPLMRNINCISCQTTTNMSVTATAAFPRARALKFGRAGDCCSIQSQSRQLSSRNWTCYTRNGARRSGGSHTKLPKAMAVCEMRYKRMKTPVKKTSSIMIYKNRFRRC